MATRTDDEFERLRIELAEARERAEEATAVKRTFLRNMSHELRTPLNAIIGYSDMLLDEVEDLGDDGGALVDDLERIRRAGRNLLGMVDDLLDMAKLEAGEDELYYEKVDLPELIRDVADSVEEQVERGGNRLTLRLDPAVSTIVTDRSKVRQVLLQLLRNAATFTRDGSIEVGTTATEADGEPCVSIAVRDDGVGIGEAALGHIFDAFRQGDDSTTREQDGAGIGLALCLEFCRSLRGDLTVVSQPGEGSTFTVSLPVKGPSTRIEEIAPMDVLDLWAGVEADVHSASTLAEAAQAFATTLDTGLGASSALVRVFLVIDAERLPDDYRRFMRERAERSGVEDELRDSTPVLSLLGSCGVDDGWKDPKRSTGHLAVPLISADFVTQIPMISPLLKDLGLPLDWMEREESDLVQRTIGRSTGLFHVENAALATDEHGRKVIPAQEFVNVYGVGSVFGMGGAYPGDEILVVVTFCTEQFGKSVAERFLPLVSLFKRETAALVEADRIFAG